MATHCSVLAWRTPWVEEPGGWSMGWQSQTPLSYFLPTMWTSFCEARLKPVERRTRKEARSQTMEVTVPHPRSPRVQVTALCVPGFGSPARVLEGPGHSSVSQRPDHYRAMPTPKPSPRRCAGRGRDAPSPSRCQVGAVAHPSAAGSVPGSGKPHGGGPGDRPSVPAWRTLGQRGSVRRGGLGAPTRLGALTRHRTRARTQPLWRRPRRLPVYLPHITATPRNTARFGPSTRHYRYREMAGLPDCLPASLPLPGTGGLATSGRSRERTLKDFLILCRRGGKTKRWW